MQIKPKSMSAEKINIGCDYVYRNSEKILDYKNRILTKLLYKHSSFPKDVTQIINQYFVGETKSFAEKTKMIKNYYDPKPTVNENPENNNNKIKVSSTDSQDIQYIPISDEIDTESILGLDEDNGSENNDITTPPIVNNNVRNNTLNLNNNKEISRQNTIHISSNVINWKIYDKFFEDDEFTNNQENSEEDSDNYLDNDLIDNKKKIDEKKVIPKFPFEDPS